MVLLAEFVACPDVVCDVFRRIGVLVLDRDGFPCFELFQFYRAAAAYDGRVGRDRERHIAQVADEHERGKDERHFGDGSGDALYIIDLFSFVCRNVIGNAMCCRYAHYQDAEK